MFGLSVVAIIYTSLVALMQEDMKKLIAYSSVAHMGFVTMGIFAATTQGVAGGIFQMISHGIVSAALFLCVGVVYDRMHTREIAAYGGLVNRMPLYAVAFMVFTLANVGLPGTSGFIGEFLALIGTFRVNTWVAALATLGDHLLRRLRAVALPQGGLGRAAEAEPRRRSRTSTTARSSRFGPLVVLTILFGVFPQPVHRFFGSFGRATARQLRSGTRRLRAGAGLPRIARCRAGVTWRPMNEAAELPALLPALPEIVLAVGAMVLLMVGAFRGEAAAQDGQCASRFCC